MFERYTDEAKRAVYFAALEASHRGARFISVRDILAGLTWEDGTRACQIAGLKEKAIGLRSAAEIPHLPITSRPYKEIAEIPLDDDGKKALAYAAAEAKHDRQFWIDTDHLLRALARFPNAVTNALAAANIEMSALRNASKQHRQRSPGKKRPNLARRIRIRVPQAKRWLKRNWAWAVLLVAFLAAFIYLKLQS